MGVHAVPLVLGWNNAVQQVKDHQNRFLFSGSRRCNAKSAIRALRLGSSRVSQRLALLALEGLSENYESEPRQREVCYYCESCHPLTVGWGNFNGTSFNHSAPPISFPLTNVMRTCPVLLPHRRNYNLQIVETDSEFGLPPERPGKKTTNPVHSSAGAAFGWPTARMP